MTERPAGRGAVVQLTLVSKAACPLCDEMKGELLHWDAGRGRFRLEVIDVRSDHDLYHRYAMRIPVLLHGDTEVCAGRFDAARLEALLDT